MNIIEGNKLIAEFTGFVRNKPVGTIGSYGRKKDWHIDLFGWFDDEDLKYHTSWDWLMPVIDKISLHQYDDKSWEGCPPYNDYAWPRTFGMISEDGKYLFRFNAQPLFEADKLIDAAWQAVVYFINQNKQS